MQSPVVTGGASLAEDWSKKRMSAYYTDPSGLIQRHRDDNPSAL